MYTLVMMTALATAPDATQFRGSLHELRIAHLGHEPQGSDGSRHGAILLRNTPCWKPALRFMEATAVSTLNRFAGRS